MNKTTLLLLVVSCCLSDVATAQTCERDSSLYVTGDLLSPAPWTPDSMYNNLAPACPGQPYTQSITLNVPDTVVYSGITISLNNLSLATSGAIAGLPPGLTYSCDPPNCVFNKLTLGCILLYGTVGDNVVPGDSTELIATVSVSSPSFPFPIPVSMPADFIPGSHYFIKYYTADQCISGTTGYDKAIFDLKMCPILLAIKPASASELRFQGSINLRFSTCLVKRCM